MAFVFRWALTGCDLEPSEFKFSGCSKTLG